MKIRHFILSIAILIFGLITIVAPIFANTVPFSELNPTRFSANTFIGDLLGGGTNRNRGLLSLSIIFGGLILLVMIIMSGFTLMMNPQNPQAQEAGKQRLTWSIIGFLILFSSFWIVQIIETIFGLNILTNDSDPDFQVCESSICTTDGVTCECQDGSNTCFGYISGNLTFCCNGTLSGSACTNP